MTWDVKDFVEATPISGPALVFITQSASLEILLSSTFVMPRETIPMSPPLARASAVSAVSPDWETAISRASGPTTGFL